MGEVLFLSLLHLFSLTCITVSPHGLLLITFLTNEVSLDIVRVGGRGHIKIINILKRDSHLCKIQFKNFLDFWIFFYTDSYRRGESPATTIYRPSHLEILVLRLLCVF